MGSHSERNRGASSRSLRVGAGAACVRRKPNLLLEEGPAASLHRWPGALTCTETVHLKAVPQGRGRRGSRPDLSPFRFLRMPCPRKAFGAHPGVTLPPPTPCDAPALLLCLRSEGGAGSGAQSPTPVGTLPGPRRVRLGGAADAARQLRYRAPNQFEPR